jgi:hypothetical protein
MLRCNSAFAQARCTTTEAALYSFGGVLDLARKKQPSCGVLSKGFLAVADIARDLRQLIGGLLSALVCGEHHCRIRSEAPDAV